MLTQKQENFCQAILQGHTQYEAYLSAYDVADTTDRAIVDNSASELSHNREIAVRIKELRDNAIASNPNILTVEQRRVILSQIGKVGEETNKIRGIQELNRMDGIGNPKFEFSNQNVIVRVLYQEQKQLGEDHEK